MFRASLRRAFSMSSYSFTAASPFTKAVVASMRKLYPESLADKSFDNTGLLLEAPFDPIRRQMNSVLLTVDLTKAVADEAIERKDCVVVAYHPIIFRGLKSLTLDDPQQQSLLRLALEGISVYCPHTAVDAVPDGMADWLCNIVTGKLSEPEPTTHTASPPDSPDNVTPAEKVEDPFTTSEKPPLPSRPVHPGLQRHYSKPTYPVLATLSQTELSPSAINHQRQTIHPNANPHPDFPSSGFGRLITFESPEPFTKIVERIARGVGSPAGFPVAVPQGALVEDLTIKTVGICPGSGASVLRDCTTHLDLIFTGELSHHDALAAIERGTAVVTLFHSNTERGYLHQVMKGKLEKEIEQEWKKVRVEVGKDKELDEDWEDALRDESVSVQVSERDRDPFGIVILEGHGAGKGTKIEGEKK